MKNHFSTYLIARSAWLLTFFTQQALAVESYQQVHTFQAPIPAAGDAYGTTVVLEGNVAAIRSNAGYFDDDPTSTTHIYELTDMDWNEVATFDVEGINRQFGPGGVVGNPFIGQELAIDNGIVVIGHSLDNFASTNNNILFASKTPTGWQTSFDEADFIAGDLITSSMGLPGRSVDISGRFAIADDSGATNSGRRLPGGNNEFTTLRGSARIYEMQSDGIWRQVTNLAPEGIITTTTSVALDGTTAVLVDRDGINDPSGVYFFEREVDGTWSQDASFLAPFDDRDAFFRSLVKIDGNTTLIRDAKTGITTIVERDLLGDWSETQQLIPPEASQQEFNGTGIALQGDLLAHTVVGANDAPNVVEIYRRHALGDWRLLDTIDDPQTTGALDFGSSIAIDGRRILIGAHVTTPNQLFDPNSPAGAAYLFAVVPEPGVATLIAAAGLCGLCLSRQIGRVSR